MAKAFARTPPGSGHPGKISGTQGRQTFEGVGAASRGNTITGNKTERLWEGNLPLRGFLRGPLQTSEKSLKPSENRLKTSENLWKCSLSEALSEPLSEADFPLRANFTVTCVPFRYRTTPFPSFWRSLMKGAFGVGVGVAGRDAIVHKKKRNSSHKELVAPPFPLFSKFSRRNNFAIAVQQLNVYATLASLPTAACTRTPRPLLRITSFRLPRNPEGSFGGQPTGQNQEYC